MGGGGGAGRWESLGGADCQGLTRQTQKPTGSGEPAIILEQWASDTTSFVSEELDENREFLTYATPEENAA